MYFIIIFLFIIGTIINHKYKLSYQNENNTIFFRSSKGKLTKIFIF